MPIDFTRADLKRAADDASWQRGEAYFHDGRVRRIIEGSDAIHARVEGTDTYDVELWVEGAGQVEADCSCPMGDSGVFCKHCVAVGLAYLAEREGSPAAEKAAKPDKSGRRNAARRPAKAKPLTLDDVRQYLLMQDAPQLAEFLVDQAAHNGKLLDVLLLKTALHGTEEFDSTHLRRAIDTATRTGGFVDYQRAPRFCRGVEDVIESIAEIIPAGHPAEAVELTERAIARCEKALGNMDDSDGGMGLVFARLAEIHHDACVAAKPDPEELARRLFKWEITTDWDTFSGAAADYADVLGDKGLAEYRRLAQKEWDQLPKLGPGQDNSSTFSERFRVTSIMESLARAKGDIEELVAVKSRDLSSPYYYLQIAEVYRAAGQDDKAMEWAEEGLADFPRNQDGRLRVFLADEYHKRGRHDEAMALVWKEFNAGRGLKEYELLKSHADRAGTWPAWREKALACIRGRKRDADDLDTSRRHNWEYARDNSVLVSIFLWEGNADDAWREAQAGGCDMTLWEGLAADREKTHPEDAITAYKTIVDATVCQTNNAAYEHAYRLIRKICRLLADSGRAAEAPLYIAHLRTTYKPKRNFIALLDRLK